VLEQRGATLTAFAGGVTVTSDHPLPYQTAILATAPPSISSQFYSHTFASFKLAAVSTAAPFQSRAISTITLLHPSNK